jgi:putative transposase
MPVVIENEPTTIKCKYCQSEAILKFGKYKGVQRYWCKSCERKFKADDTTPHMKTNASEVSSAVSMWYEGMSLEAINRQLLQNYGHTHSSATLYEWIQKYTAYAVDSAKDYHPKVGNTWVADETVLKIDGQNVWLWDIIDTDTRFLLATRLTTSRTGKDAQLLMERALKRAGKKPIVLATDKLPSYQDINLGVGSEHHQGSPFQSEDSTSLIERWHGTLKARTKVMRGLKNLETAHDFCDGFLVHYNFLRPHESLGGKTPAEVAGIAYPYKNWDELSRKHKPTVTIRVTHVERGKMKPTKTHIGRPRKVRISQGKNLGGDIVRDRRGQHLRLY